MTTGEVTNRFQIGTRSAYRSGTEGELIDVQICDWLKQRLREKLM